MIERVTSSSNPAIKLARALQSRRRDRYREAAFVVEGFRSLQSLVEAGAKIRVLFLADHLAEDVTSTPNLLAIVDAASRVLAIPSPLFASISDTETPSGIAAIVGMPDLPFPKSSSLALAVDGVQDPGNLGTILRTAAAAGIDGVALLPGCVDPYNPKVVRGAAGTLATIPIRQVPSLEDLVFRVFTAKPQVVVADASGPVTYDEVDWTRPTALVVGGEGTGPGDESLALADVVASIPIAASVESLNVAVATGVMLFEAERQRRKVP